MKWQALYMRFKGRLTGR